MNDMSMVIVPKSDQMNADDLLSGSRTITITKVTIRPGTEQPVSIFFEGDDGKPWKPCKSMSRVLVSQWGPDAAQYVGRSLTLYNDPKVLWGGLAVGGIRISHMSNIEGAVTMALTATKGSRKPFTVKPLAMPKKAEATPAAGKKLSWFEKASQTIARASDIASLDALRTRSDVADALTNPAAPEDIRVGLEACFREAYRKFADPDAFDGDADPDGHYT